MDNYTIIEQLGEGEFGITYRAIHDDLGAVAIKILKKDDPNWKDEAKRASKLRGVDQIVTVFDIVEGNFDICGKSEHMNFIVWEYVDGQTLYEYLQSTPYVPTTFIINLIRELCSGIWAMRDSGLEHGDLHTKNIMLIEPKKWEQKNEYKLKIVDFGLAKSIRREYVKDMHFLSDHIKNCLQYMQSISSTKTMIVDKKFQNQLLALIKKLDDADEERGFNHPENVINYLDNLYDQTEDNQKNLLSHPFDFLSVEEIPENSNLIQELYVNTVPWLNQIHDSNITSIISGPRGSGKSMILKNMRLLTKLESLEFNETYKKLNYVGFYLHCQYMLYFPFSGLDIIYDTSTCNKFIHYFNLLLTSEILKSIITLQRKNILTLSDPMKKNLLLFIQSNFIDHDMKILSSKNEYDQYDSSIEHEIIICQNQIINNIPLSNPTASNYIHELIKILDDASEFFSMRKIYILLDDYSKPKINENVQKSLNRIIAYRNPRFCFKVTTEKFGFVYEDQDGKSLDQDREYEYIDLGSKYVRAMKIDKMNFIKNIFNKRLQNNKKTKTNVDDFFGPKPFEGKIARQLVDKNKNIQTNFNYSGFHMIFKLCMGDISTILQLSKEIYFEWDKNVEHITPVSMDLQNMIIRKFSYKRLDAIKTTLKYGMKLYNFVIEFGKLSQSILRNSDIDDKASEILSLEIDVDHECIKRNYEFYEYLTSSNIFVNGDEVHPPKKTSGVIRNRLYLRSIYTPALNISYNDRNTKRYTCDKFNEILSDPSKFNSICDVNQKTLDDVLESETGDHHDLS